MGVGINDAIKVEGGIKNIFITKEVHISNGKDGKFYIYIYIVSILKHNKNYKKLNDKNKRFCFLFLFF